jgi:hypothetical protein
LHKQSKRAKPNQAQPRVLTTSTWRADKRTTWPTPTNTLQGSDYATQCNTTFGNLIQEEEEEKEEEEEEEEEKEEE